MTKARCSALVFLLAVTFLLLQLHTAAFADDDDPPGRVARMNFTEGSVSFQPGGEGDWLTASPNRPLTSGDNLWTDRDSRDELHAGSTILRMGPETSVTLLDLDDNNTQLRLAQGSLIVRVRHVDDGDNYEVDTPNTSFIMLLPGKYRIDVDPDGTHSTVTVWQGKGEVTGGGYTYDVFAGQRALFDGEGDLRHDIESIRDNDDFERWAADRDSREDHFDSHNYVSEEMTGYEDLDDYGRWNYVANYGNVWVPNSVPAGWAPYRNGHWAWIDPWGWTWVDDEPWGFAPFHYGRWSYASSGWFWVPGPAVVRPVYAPALVAFVGGASFSFGGGPAVGWFPLAPGEVYVPSYRVSERYVNQVNITNTRVDVTRVTNVYHTYINEGGREARPVYVNQRITNAVTVVPRETFVNARPVSRSLVRGDERQLAEAQVIHQAPAEPARASVLGAAPPARVRPPAAIVNRQVVAVHAPAPVRPSFEQRQGGSRPAAENVRQQTPARPARPEADSRQEQATRPDQQPRSPQATSPAQESRNVARPPEASTVQPSRPTPEASRQEPNRPAEVNREPSPQQDNRATEPAPHPQPEPRQQQQWSHPLARAAAPPREPTPEQSRQEEQKFHDWQQRQQRPVPPAAAPRPAPEARPAPPDEQRRPAPRPPEKKEPDQK